VVAVIAGYASIKLANVDFVDMEVGHFHETLAACAVLAGQFLTANGKSTYGVHSFTSKKVSEERAN
jgi:hypothetical protein